jgi:hypothetical protein
MDKNEVGLRRALFDGTPLPASLTKPRPYEVGESRGSEASVFSIDPFSANSKAFNFFIFTLQGGESRPAEQQRDT